MKRKALLDAPRLLSRDDPDADLLYPMRSQYALFRRLTLVEGDVLNASVEFWFSSHREGGSVVFGAACMARDDPDREDAFFLDLEYVTGKDDAPPSFTPSSLDVFVCLTSDVCVSFSGVRCSREDDGFRTLAATAYLGKHEFTLAPFSFWGVAPQRRMSVEVIMGSRFPFKRPREPPEEPTDYCPMPVEW